MSLSESVFNALSGGDESLVTGLATATILVVLNGITALVTVRSSKVKTWLEGNPVLIGRDGEILQQALKAQHIPESDVKQALRAADYDQLSLQYAFLEPDGTISILKKSADDRGPT